LLSSGHGHVLLTGPRLGAAVAGLALDQLVAWGVLYYAYTILSQPIASDLGVSRLVVAAAFSVCLLVAGWAGRRLGPFLDARGTRDALRIGALVAPLAFAAVAGATDAAVLVIAFVLVGIAQALTLYEPAFRTIVDWCPEERSRTRAMLLLTSIGGFASTVFLPLTSWLVVRHGWRTSVLVLAVLLAVVLLPSRLLLPLSTRRHWRAPIADVQTPRSARVLAVGLAMHSLASTGVFVYLTWHLVERGESLGGAAAVAGIAGAAQVPGRLLAGPLRRIVGARGFLPLLLAIQAVALVGVVVASRTPATLCVLVLGAASGMMTLERATVLIEWYGRTTFGARQGNLAAATSTARALSPFVVEAGHHVASYAAVFGVLALALGVGAYICRGAARIRQLELAATSVSTDVSALGQREPPAGPRQEGGEQAGHRCECRRCCEAPDDPGLLIHDSREHRPGEPAARVRHVIEADVHRDLVAVGVREDQVRVHGRVDREDNSE
jgi:MFS family permease